MRDGEIAGPSGEKCYYRAAVAAGGRAGSEDNAPSLSVQQHAGLLVIP